MSASARRDERITAAHEAATAPAGWFCRVKGCHIADVRQPARSYEAAIVDAEAHYDRSHFVADWKPGMASVRV